MKYETEEMINRITYEKLKLVKEYTNEYVPLGPLVFFFNWIQNFLTFKWIGRLSFDSVIRSKTYPGLWPVFYIECKNLKAVCSQRIGEQSKPNFVADKFDIDYKKRGV